MKKLVFLIILSVGSLVYAQNQGGRYYVATSGNDSNPGTFTQPWATWQKAFNEAKPGDTVYFRGGVYYSTSPNVINPHAWPKGIGHSGTAENPICYFGYPGEWPVLDCVLHCNSPNIEYNQAINLSYVEHIHFKDFEVRNVLQCDSVISGGISATYSRNLTFEHIILHEIAQRGFYILGGAWLTHYEDGDTDRKPYWDTPYDTTRFINCDVYNLMDSISATGNPPRWDPGNGADAWKTVHYRGNYISWTGCRAWNFSDDGWDPSSVNGAIRVWDNCWVMASNKYYDPGASWITERNGIKIAGTTKDMNWNPDPNINYAVVTNCLAVYCTLGFVELDGDTRWRNNTLFYNNTAFRNGIGFSGSLSTDRNPRTSIFKNNIAFGATSVDPGLKLPYEVALMGNSYKESHNTWNWIDNYPSFEKSNRVTVTNNDFISVDSLAIVSLFTAPRQSDGSLPLVKPLFLAENSDLINAGTDVGLSYNGSAPDIGAFEYDRVPGTNNEYPSINLTSPSNGSIFIKPFDIDLIAKATDRDGSIIKIEFFYEDSIKINERNSAPWSIKWSNSPVGRYPLRAKAINNKGASTLSSRIWVTVLPNIHGTEDIGFIYPNPNNGAFTFVLTKPLRRTSEISITDLNGKLIYKGIIHQEEMTKQFDLSHLKSGIYIVTLFSNEVLLTNRFIKL